MTLGLLAAPVCILVGLMMDVSRASSMSVMLRITARVAVLSCAVLGVGAAGALVVSCVLVFMALGLLSLVFA